MPEAFIIDCHRKPMKFGFWGFDEIGVKATYLNLTEPKKRNLSAAVSRWNRQKDMDLRIEFQETTAIVTLVGYRELPEPKPATMSPTRSALHNLKPGETCLLPLFIKKNGMLDDPLGLRMAQRREQRLGKKFYVQKISRTHMEIGRYK